MEHNGIINNAQEIINFAKDITSTDIDSINEAITKLSEFGFEVHKQDEEYFVEEI